MKLAVITALVVAAAASDAYFRLPQPYSYSCQESQESQGEGFCKRVDRAQATEFKSLRTCQLTCGSKGAIWPEPTGEVRIDKETVSFSPSNFRVIKTSTSDKQVERMLQDSIQHFQRNMHFLHPDYPATQKQVVTEEEYQKKGRFDQQQYEDFQQFDQQNDQQFDHQYDQQYNQRRRNDFRDTQRCDPYSRTCRQQYRQNRPQGMQRQQYLRYSPFQRQSSNPGVERQQVLLEVTVTAADKRLRLNTDESYNVVVQTVGDETTITILAPTYYGARHALETVSQLIAYDEINDSLQIVKTAYVQDEPRFRYRGFMLDTGRNYFPKEDLMSLMDSMAYNKMNYFHWHITDAASFPMYSNRRPEMAYYGAYTSRKVYYPEDIKEIVEYANLRGISIIPELDGPAHASAGWQWGEKEGKGRLVVCTGNEAQEPWFDLAKEPPSGQFNPINDELYNVMEELYRDFMDYFDPEMVHMGGDDVSFKCWQNTPEVLKYLEDRKKEPNSRELFELWNNYQSRAYNKLQDASPGREITPILHSSSFALNYVVPQGKYIIQLNEFANVTEIGEYVTKGARVIFSNQDQWNLDCLASNWMGDKAANCIKSKETPNWENFYRNSPLDMLTTLGISNARTGLQSQPGTPFERDLVLGGEATLWSYDTDSNGFQAKIWPRMSAFAERLWTDPEQLNMMNAGMTQRRLNIQRQRMAERGIQADPLQPEYCMHDEGACFSQEQYRARSALFP